MKKLVSSILICAMLACMLLLPVSADIPAAPECAESQINPDWLITELSADNGGDGTNVPEYNDGRDPFEFIEIYNNSDKVLNLYDYCLTYLGDSRSNANFEKLIKEVTPFLTSTEDKVGNYIDGSPLYSLWSAGTPGKMKDDDTISLVMNDSMKNPVTCNVQPGECVVLWVMYYEAYLSIYHDNPDTPEKDGIGMTVTDFRKHHDIDDNVKVILVDGNSNVENMGNAHNFNVKNSGCGTYGIAKYTEELKQNCNTPTADNAQAAGLTTEGYAKTNDLICWASMDIASSRPVACDKNSKLTSNFVPDVSGDGAEQDSYIWSGGRMVPLEYNAYCTAGSLTDLQKLFICPDKLAAGTNIKFLSTNTSIYIMSPYKARTETHNFNFMGYTINGVNISAVNAADEYVVPTEGITSFTLWYEMVERTQFQDDDEEPSDNDDDGTTTASGSNQNPAANTTTAAKEEPTAEKKSCGGIASIAAVFAVMCGALGVAVIKKY